MTQKTLVDCSVLKQVLDALEGCRIEYDFHGNPMDSSDKDVIKAIEALRAELENQDHSERREVVSDGVDHAYELRRHSRKIGYPAGESPGVMLRAADEIDKLRSMLAAVLKTPMVEQTQVEQPVAWGSGEGYWIQHIDKQYRPDYAKYTIPFYSRHQPRQPLTEDAVRKLILPGDYLTLSGLTKLVRAVEFAHGIGSKE